MDRIVGGEYRWGVADIFSLRSAQGSRLNHEQRLRLKKDGRPCPLIKYCANVEQSAISVRLVYEGEVEEHLLGLVDASKDQSVDGLSKILLETLKNFKITPEISKEKLIGQSYDGAPTMSGHLNGVQSQIKSLFPYAFYNHCVAHRMALCASRSANSIPQVAKFFGTTDKLITFFRSSPKRTTHLGHNLHKPGDTRWLSRDSAICVIDKCYETIGTVLYELANTCGNSSETQTLARGLGMQIQTVEFVFLLKLYRKIFEHCTPITKMMQKITLDPVTITSMLEDFQLVLLDFGFDKIWADTLLADPEIPVIRARRGWRNMEPENKGTHESWKDSLVCLGKEIAEKLSEELTWRFANLPKFKWMDLIHPTKFEERRKASTKTKEL
eukprot:gene8392-9293_t